MLHHRELARAEASLTHLTEASLLPAPPAAPSPEPTARTPRRALDQALEAVLAVMQEPRDGRLPALQRVADDGFVHAFERQIQHLQQNNLRLSSRSDYQMLYVEHLSQEADRASLLTEERWLYEEETPDGRTARCLAEVSTQRYLLELRADGWVVTDLILISNPRRQPCPEQYAADARH